jgi:hypothetical protein
LLLLLAGLILVAVGVLAGSLIIGLGLLAGTLSGAWLGMGPRMIDRSCRR